MWLPVAPVALRHRWSQRRLLGPTVLWLVCLGLPYVLVLGVDPLSKVPRLVSRELHLPAAADVHGLVLMLLGLLSCRLCSGFADLSSRRNLSPRALRLLLLLCFKVIQPLHQQCLHTRQGRDPHRLFADLHS